MLGEKGLGSTQKDVLDSLRHYGKWFSGCGWVWDTPSGTERIMKSLVKRGLVEYKPIKLSDGAIYKNAYVLKEEVNGKQKDFTQI